MYGLYLRYIKYRDEFQNREEQITIQKSLNLSWNKFCNESIPFQLSYITACGWAIGIFGSSAYLTFRSHRQGLRDRIVILDAITRPFLKSLVGTLIISFTVGLIFVHNNKKTHSFSEEK